MKIPLSELPPEIYQRLKDIQDHHSEYAGYYQAGGGRGWAIFGLIWFSLSMLGLMGMVATARMGLVGWIVTGLWNSWLLVICVRHLKRYKQSPVKPYTFLNPLYLTKVTLKDVTYYNLWADREDLNITHHYTNGIYTNTEFAFRFKDGSETLYVSPKHQAEDLIDMIEAYRVHMLEAIESEDYESILGHDIFFEMEHGDAGAKSKAAKKGGFAWNVWGMTAAAGVLIGSALFFMNASSVQSARLDSCERRSVSKYSSSFGPISCYQGYFKYFSPVLYKDRAQQGLYESYKKKFMKISGSASKVRDAVAQTEFPHLGKILSDQLKQFYADEGKKALDYLYKQASDDYKAKASTAHPPARQAIMKLLDLAKNQDNYVVRIRYNRKIKAVMGGKTIRLKSGRSLYIQPMASSFTTRHNVSRESAISYRVKKAFKRIIPEDILQFGPDGDLEFNITYTLRPASIYTLTSKRTGRKRYYNGIRIFWHFKILNKGKLLYEFFDTTRPAKRFSVRSSYYRSRYSRYSSAPRVPNSTFYDKMAATTFDNYSRRILVHFGVVRPGYSDRKYRKLWKLFTKLGVFKDLAAGKSFKEIDWKAKYKAAGIPYKGKRSRRITRTRRTRYRRRRTRYRRRRYRRRRYRRRRYRRYRRRRPTRRRSNVGNWLE